MKQWICIRCRHRWEIDTTGQHCDRYGKGNHPPTCPACEAPHRTSELVSK